MGEKFKFSAQGSDLAPFVSNGTKFKIPSGPWIKPPLHKCTVQHINVHSKNLLETMVSNHIISLHIN